MGDTMSAKPPVNTSDWLPEVEGRVDSERVANQSIGPGWPEALAPEAFHGLAGEIVSILEPHSEADPVGLLMHLLVSFGNAVGRVPHFVVGGTVHHANLYCVNVGATASRKGTAKDDTFFVIRSVDADWFDGRVQSGLSSGEGFVWAVRDPIEEQQPIKEKGRVIDYQTVIVDPGVKDKRLLVVESEFGSTLRVLEREGNTLSAQIRQAWDSGTLRILTKTKAARATDAHVSILGHVTREELLKYLNETEQANGFANRILWAAVRRSKLLPDGGEINRLDLSGIVRRLREAVQFARTVGEVRRSEAARDIWHAVYPRLAGDRFGLFGAVTSRAEAQTMRLALVYALLDCSRLIEAEHLSAGLAVWSYCEASARLIFGDALGDVTADEVLKALRAAPSGLTRTELSSRFGRNKSASEINRALTVLTQHGLVRSEKEDATAGRPAERWFSISLGTKETNLTKEPTGDGQ
jgi:DNA-binding transcriptional ArsR family regulator